MRLRGAIRVEFDLSELLQEAAQPSNGVAPEPTEGSLIPLSPVWFDDGAEGQAVTLREEVWPAILQQLARRVDLGLLSSLMLYRSGSTVHAVGLLGEPRAEPSLPPRAAEPVSRCHCR
ncbi:MAG: hypothetical protein IMX01_05035 [Limnochordaceae bacterium]|nr:hypothetical protein [Limnochordaceae bacterium]